MTSVPQFAGTVRPYEAGHAAKVEAFLEAVWLTDTWEAHLPSAARHAFVAEQQGQVCGLACAHERTIHPYTLTLDLSVPPSRWSDGSADALFAELAATLPDQLWRTQLLEPHAAGGFLQHHGFFEVRRTWTPTLDVADLPHAQLADAHAQALRLGFDLDPLGRGVDDDVLMDALVEAHLEHYTATHSVNPAAPRPLSSWRGLFLGDDLDPAAAFLARRDGAIAAFTSLRADGAGAWEVAWFGTLAPYRAYAHTLNLALKHHEEGFARRRGIARLGFEVDSTDPEAVAVLGTLAEAKGEALVTYQTGIPR
jgi:hypothetical protein